jgi:hypothetical protein
MPLAWLRKNTSAGHFSEVWLGSACVGSSLTAYPSPSDFSAAPSPSARFEDDGDSSDVVARRPELRPRVVASTKSTTCWTTAKTTTPPVFVCSRHRRALAILHSPITTPPPRAGQVRPCRTVPRRTPAFWPDHVAARPNIEVLSPRHQAAVDDRRGLLLHHAKPSLEG